MKIKVGDRVETIDDNISGIVTKVSGDLVVLSDEDGFEIFKGKINLS